MIAKRKKPEFRVGQTINLPVKVLKVDRRFIPERYIVQAAEGGWVFEGLIKLEELKR